VTTEDVKFTYESYRGTNAKRLHDQVERIDLVDNRTVRFVFKEPFLDFLVLYGSAASGAGWIVPKKYYEEVGKDGFKNKPIGAGPYKLVRQVVGSELELESYTAYWRKTPSVKTLIVKTIPDDSTRLAALQVGEVDLAVQMPIQSLDVLRNDAQLKPAIVNAPAVTYLEFPGFEQPDNIFHDKRIRQALGLALDRQALSAGETGGVAPVVGHWIPEDWPGALKVPLPEENVAKAKQLLAEAGYPNGLDAEMLTTYQGIGSLGERVLSQLRAIGVTGRLNAMEVSAYYAALAKNQTPDRLRGIVLEYSGGAGDAAGRIDSLATCQGVRSPKCVPQIQERYQRYTASQDPQERTRLLEEMQRFTLDEHIFVPIYRGIWFQAQGPRIANDPAEIWGAIPQFQFLGPYEDIRLTE
jgi:peptide/nickel transport system substrate-binding protein